jgi:hypothetical protein
MNIGLDLPCRPLSVSCAHRPLLTSATTPSPLSDLLLSRASDLDADLIVAGAYHHSRFGAALLGGVSREPLDPMTVPAPMSH